MTHATDDLLSALIDGEPLPSVDAAHVEDCGECQERLDRLRDVSALVATPVVMPAGHVREAAVAAALVETTGVTPAIRRLLPRRDRAMQARRRSALSAAAALLVALAVGGLVLSQLGSDNADDTATNTALNNSSAAGGGVSESADAADSKAFSAVGDDLASAGDIGAHEDLASVAAKYREAMAQREGAATATTDAPCPLPDGHVVQWHVSLTYNGEAAYARVVTDPASARTLQVLRQTDCGLLGSQAL